MGEPVRWPTFLKDVLICSLGAYGGPEAHVGVFIDQLVTRRKYLSEGELIELVALCSVLPGPTSTQTIVAVGHKTGGPLLALLTMLVWSMPALIMMTLLSFVFQFLVAANLPPDGLRFVGPMAVGFIIVAAFRIGRRVATSRLTAILLVGGGILTYLVRQPWLFPLVLLAGGLVVIIASKETNIWNKVAVSPPWVYLIIFAGIALAAIGLTQFSDHLLPRLFESFYRYGYLVFGGGQVVVPLMYGEMVQINQYMTSSEFLTGYGLVQGLPGPMFSFSAYIGGMAARGQGGLFQVAGAALGGLGIFLPGLLLIYFAYPVWESLKGIKAIKISLTGINAVAGGMIAAAAVFLTQRNGLTAENLIVTGLSMVLLLCKKIPAPLIVLVSILAGFLI